uniref:Uncharacterized protein n=2 Tax=Oryza TaxID=4527 RepID=A0A0D3H3D3_9ORYZ
MVAALAAALFVCTVIGSSPALAPPSRRGQGRQRRPGRLPLVGACCSPLLTPPTERGRLPPAAACRSPPVAAC